MMQRATKVNSLRSGIALASLLTFLLVGFVVRQQVRYRQETTRIEGLVKQLVSADPSQIPSIVNQLDANHDRASGYLSPLVSENGKSVTEQRARLHAQLATVSHDKSLVEPLLEELFSNKVAYISPIRQQLRPYAGELTEKLRAILRDEKVEANRRFRAAMALADYVPESDSAFWTDADLQFVAEQLVSDNAEFQPVLRENLKPISGQLLPDLEKIFGAKKSNDAERLSAANAFADYAASDIAKLSQLLTVATPGQYAVLYPLVAAAPAPSTVEELGKITATLPPEELGSVERVPYGQRRANAAVSLLRLGEREKVLSVFEMTDDPEALTQFIFRCRDRGVRVEELLELLAQVSPSPATHPSPPATHARYALLLTLGEYSLNDIPESQRETLLAQLADWYRIDPSSGVHGAAGWLLRQWGQNDVVRRVDQTPVPYSPDREWFTLAITVTPTSPPKEKPEEEGATADAGAKTDQALDAAESYDEETDKPDETAGPKSPPDDTSPEAPPEQLPAKTFYYTFIVFPPGDFTIGSVGDEPDRNPQENTELRHAVKLTRSFAILDREVTMAELIAYNPSYSSFMEKLDRIPEDAGYAANWYDSVDFCRWLSQQWGVSESEQSYPFPDSLDSKEYPREPDPTANRFPMNWPLKIGQRGFHLPTESEWEVASRAGSRTTYGFGSDASLLGRFGWVLENCDRHVHPPRAQRPSFRGLFDMHGNVWELTHDWQGDFDTAAQNDPIGPKEGLDRMLRGGGWDLGAAFCRSAYRLAYPPAYRSISSGFRLALCPSDVPDTAEQRPEMP